MYSKYYSFETSHYSANGLSFQIMHDSRDNPVNPYRGNYMNLSFRVNPVFPGSSQGSIQGRFRGDNMMYGESEFRFRLSKDGLLGGVAFLNCTTTSNPLLGVKQSLFVNVAPGYGVGLRIKMNKNDRTNIAVDYGRGSGFSGIYFNIREAF